MSFRGCPFLTYWAAAAAAAAAFFLGHFGYIDIEMSGFLNFLLEG